MWLNPQKTMDLVTITDEFFNGKLHFLYREKCISRVWLDSECPFTLLTGIAKNKSPFTFTYAKSTIETQKMVQNVFIVINKNNRTMSLKYWTYTLNIFHIFF